MDIQEAGDDKNSIELVRHVLRVLTRPGSPSYNYRRALLDGLLVECVYRVSS